MRCTNQINNLIKDMKQITHQSLLEESVAKNINWADYVTLCNNEGFEALELSEWIEKVSEIIKNKD